MSWVWNYSRSKPTQRLVLLAIADCANDHGAEAYPSNATLAAKTGLSERGVRKAIAELEALGELEVQYKSGPHGCNRYRVIMSDPAPDARSSGIPEADGTRHNVPGTRHDVPGTRHDMPGTHPAPHSGNPARRSGDPAPRSENPAPRAPKPLEPSLTIKNRQRGAREKRGTRIPDDFAVTAEMVAWARERVPNVDGRWETEKFINYWRAASGATAVKRDWVAAWRTWMLKAAERAPTGGRIHAASQPQMGTTERKMRAALEAGRQAQALYDQQQQRLEIAS